MSVKLEEVVFQNDNGIEVSLTVEAPVGHTVVDQHPVEANATYRVQPGVENCTSILLVAKAASHDADREEFTVSGRPTQAYLKQVSARYVIGSIHGSVAGRTDRG